jgi:branched-chain amino acid aminotransferase
LPTLLSSSEKGEAHVSVCWLDGTVLPGEEARISVFDHGLLYGDGVFEGIRFYQRQPFRLQTHLRRLQHSAMAIKLTLSYTLHELETAVHEVIQAFGEVEGYLRLVITRGKGSLGVNPNSCQRATTFIVADKLSFIDPQVKQLGASLIIAATRRLPPDGLDPRVKSLNYLNHVLARIEANHANADEAILLNAQGHVSEGTTDNVFIVREGVLLTPPVTDGALDGVTRGVIMELAMELGLPCTERTLSPYDLYTAEECFLTGTAMELIPVREIDGRALPVCPGSLYRRLQQAFTERIQTEVRYAVVEQAAS